MVGGVSESKEARRSETVSNYHGECGLPSSGGIGYDTGKERAHVGNRAISD